MPFESGSKLASTGVRSVLKQPGFDVSWIESSTDSTKITEPHRRGLHFEQVVMNPSPKSLLDQVLAGTVTLVLIAVGLSWAWHLLRPLIPVLIASAVAVLAMRVLWVRRHDW
jgi:hypothetical protein